MVSSVPKGDCVPNVDGTREMILGEAHNSQYSIHLGSIKIYRDLRCIGGME